MKKMIALMLALTLTLALCGCGSTKAEAPQSGTPVSTFYQGVLDAQPEGVDELVFFEESDPAMIESFYPGLDKIELAQSVFYMPPVATHPCEIVLVEVAQADQVEEVEEIFRTRIELGADNTTYPDSAAGWQKYAQVQTSGNFVCMIVLPQAYTIPENVFAQ